MSIADTTTCFSFKTEEELMKKYTNKPLYVIATISNEKKLFEIEVYDIFTSINHYNRNYKGTTYFDFHIIYYEKEKYIISETTKKYFGGLLKKTTKKYGYRQIRKKEKITSSMYTSDFYSIICPSGYIFEHNLYLNKEEAMLDLKSTSSNKNKKIISSNHISNGSFVKNKTKKIQ